ncbi:MAG: hypothetical protein ACI4P3_04205, partial [Candidatus Spyradosoma sp.]
MADVTREKQVLPVGGGNGNVSGSADRAREFRITVGISVVDGQILNYHVFGDALGAVVRARAPAGRRGKEAAGQIEDIARDVRICFFVIQIDRVLIRLGTCVRHGRDAVSRRNRNFAKAERGN